MEHEGLELNAMFMDAVTRGQEGLDKVSAEGGLFIQEKMRENSFARKVLPPKTVVAGDLQRDEFEDTQYFLDDLEPDSMAMQINMRGEPSKVFIEAPRYRINFGTITTPRFTKTESELRAYRMPITRVIEQNSVKDMQEQEDLIFMHHVRAALLQATRSRMNDLSARGIILHQGDNLGTPITGGQNFGSKEDFASYMFTKNVALAANGGNLAGTTIPHAYTNVNFDPVVGLHSNIVPTAHTSFVRDLLVQAEKVQAARQMEATVCLVHQYDWVDVKGWLDTEAGLSLTSEIVRDGYKYVTIGGTTFITTLRQNDEILAPGQVFTFPAPEFLGRFLILGGVKFQVEKNFRFIHMEAWEECGIGLGNIHGLGCALMAGASMDFPNLFQNTAGVQQGPTTRTFTFTNDVANPV